MAEEDENLDTAPTIPKNALWDYEVPYSMASDHIHATVAALDPLVPTLGAAFKLSRVAEPKLTSNAVFSATAWLFRIARRVDLARRLGLEAEIDKAFRPFARIVSCRVVISESS
jgi:hypothetical protein